VLAIYTFSIDDATLAEFSPILIMRKNAVYWLHLYVKEALSMIILELSIETSVFMSRSVKLQVLPGLVQVGKKGWVKPGLEVHLIHQSRPKNG